MKTFIITVTYWNEKTGKRVTRDVSVQACNQYEANRLVSELIQTAHFQGLE
jgi:hypothetical protein